MLLFEHHHTHTMKRFFDPRLICFSEFESINPLRVLSILPAIGQADAGLERARQPTQVAEIYAKAAKEMQEAKNGMERFQMAVHLLFGIFFGDRSERRQDPEEAPVAPEQPEAVLRDLLTTLTVSHLIDSLQSGLDKAMREGLEHSHRAHTRVQQVLEEMVANKLKQARELNKLFPIARLPVPELQKATFGVNDHLAIVLKNVDPAVKKSLLALNGKGQNVVEAKDGTIILRGEGQGLQFQGNGKNMQVVPYSFAQGETGRAVPTMARDASRSQEISDLSKQVFSTMMELQALQGSSPPKPTDFDRRSNHVDHPDEIVWENHQKLIEETQDHLSLLIRKRCALIRYR